MFESPRLYCDKKVHAFELRGNPKMFQIGPEVRKLKEILQNLFCVHLTIEYDYMCSETDFNQEKSHLYPTTTITIHPYRLPLLCNKLVG